MIILDVRNKDEANAGMIKGAVLIPEEELAARIAELPKDKRIIVHCSTGIRAEMAYHKLKDAGYKAGFLNAEIDIDKQGDVQGHGEGLIADPRAGLPVRPTDEGACRNGRAFFSMLAGPERTWTRG